MANYALYSSVCLVFINSWSGEGGDRSEIYNTEQDALILEIAANCNNTVVVINISGTRLLEAWIENENITAVIYTVIYTGNLGQESGNAIADVLYGDVNSSGRLLHTIAKNESDSPVGICTTAEYSFDEGVYIDYRCFDKQGIEPRFPFGHGLSYTSFTYSSFGLSVTNASALASKYPTGWLGLGGTTDLWDEVVTVGTTVTNSGAVDGAEVAQLYVGYPDDADQPVRQLRGFEKVYISTGASASVTFSVRRRDLSYWDVVARKWAIASGTYTFGVGASLRDSRGNLTLTI